MRLVAKGRPLDSPELVRAVRSPRRLAVDRFRANRLAVLGLGAVVLIAILSIGAPWLASVGPNTMDTTASRQPPSPEHLLGTDLFGRDVLSRLMYGGQVSLGVGIAAAVVSTSIGLLLGALAGFYRGRVDQVISRLTEIVLSFPLLVVIIVLVSIAGPGASTMIIGLGLFIWPTTARIVRGMTLSLREQDFVVASRVIGLTDRQLIVRHIVPSVLGPLTVTATFSVAFAVLVEASLSFLGLGVRPPQATWGTMLNEAQSILVLESMPWLWIPPGLAVAITVLAINFVGDGLRDALDPRQQAAPA